MKKFIAIALTAIMLLSALPIAIFAEGDTSPIKIVDANGNDVAAYDSLQSAVDAVKDTQKIVILEDYTLASCITFKGTYDASNLRNVVIEGATKPDGSKVTVTCTSYFADQLGCYNLTIRNLNIVSSGSKAVFMFDPYAGGWLSDFASSTFIVDNCTITAPSASVFSLVAQSSGAAYKKHNPFIVKVKDSTISSGGAAGTSVICVPWNTSASVDLSVENSTIMAVGGNATAPNPETSYVFCFNPIKGGVSDFSSTCNVTVDGTSKLIANFTGTVTPTGGIFNNIGGTATITLAKGAELYVNNSAEKTQNAFILNTRGTTTITDNGAVWKVGADTAKKGISLPEFIENGEKHVWFVGNEMVSTPYTNASATGDVVLTHAKLNDPALNPDNVAYVEGANGSKTYYTSVKTALSQAPNGSTIEIIRDSSYTGHGTFTSKSLTINGNNHTLTTSGGYTFDVCGAAGNYITVKNLKVNSARFMYNEFSTVNIENCEINDSYGLVFSIALPDGVDAVINIKDSKFNLNTTNNEPFGRTGNNASKNCDVTWNLQNSDIIMTTSKAADGGDNARSCFNLLTSGVVTFNMDATSSLTMNGQYMRNMFYGHNATGGLVLNLANGADIAVENCAAGAHIASDNLAGKFTVVNAFDFVVGESAAANGVYLPVFAATGETLVGYAKDGKIYNARTTTAGAYNTSDLANVVSFGSSDFAMQDGAALRTVWQENGIRFTTEISADLYNALKDNAVFGTVIAPDAEGANPNEYEGDKLDIVATKTQTVDGKVLIRAAVIMPETATAYKFKLAANAYFTVTYADGTNATFNTAFGEENVRSMLDVATNLKAQGYTNAAVEGILAACAE